MKTQILMLMMLFSVLDICTGCTKENMKQEETGPVPNYEVSVKDYGAV